MNIKKKATKKKAKAKQKTRPKPKPRTAVQKAVKVAQVGERGPIAANVDGVAKGRLMPWQVSREEWVEGRKKLKRQPALCAGKIPYGRPSTPNAEAARHERETCIMMRDSAKDVAAQAADGLEAAARIAAGKPKGDIAVAPNAARERAKNPIKRNKTKEGAVARHGLNGVDLSKIRGVLKSYRSREKKYWVYVKIERNGRLVRHRVESFEDATKATVFAESLKKKTKAA